MSAASGRERPVKSKKKPCHFGVVSFEVSGKDDRRQIIELGSRTRRRLIGQDYAAAKDADIGSMVKEDRGHMIMANIQEPATIDKQPEAS